MSSTNEFNDKSMNFRRLRRFLVEWLIPVESAPEFPWEINGDTVDPELGPLAFGPGLLWGDGVRKSLRWNWDDYEATTGIPLGADGTPSTFVAARQKFYGAVTAGSPIVFEHEFNTWPIVQAIQRGGGASGVPWTSFTAFTATFDIDLDTVTVDFGGAFDGIVVIVG